MRPDGWLVNINRSLIMYGLSQTAVKTPAQLSGNVTINVCNKFY